MTSAKSLAGLMKWLDRDGWRAFLHDVIEERFDAANARGLEPEEVEASLGEVGVANLWGCAFEDFLTRWDDDDRNIIEEYLKRRGWKETGLNRKYMNALRLSVISLYEVSDVKPGESFLARDLVRDGDPVLVFERSGSAHLKEWDRISARLVDMGGRFEMAGGVLAFDRETSDELLGALKDLEAQSRGHLEELVAEIGEAPAAKGKIDEVAKQALLQTAAPIFSTFWLSDFLKKTLDPEPRKITNSDGEDLVMVTMRFPLVPSVKRDRALAALEAIAGLRPASKTFWNWLRTDETRMKGAKKRRKPADATMLIAAMEDGSTILGTVELKGRVVLFATNSRERAAVGRAMLEKHLAGLVKEPTVETQTPDQLMASRSANKAQAASVDLPPEEVRALIHGTLDDYYRQQLDEPIPMLGNLSPRTAIKTEAGQEKVVAWLKTLENHMAHVPVDDQMAGYDTLWLWDELGLIGRRR